MSIENLLNQSVFVDSSDGEKLFVQTWGQADKPAMVLVHGYPDNQETWQRIVPFLTDDFYVVTYDVRGAGRSSVPKHISSYRLPQLAKDLDAVTQSVLANRPFHLAAHDWGSIQSWEAVTDPAFTGRILSYTTLSGPCLDHVSFFLRDVLKNKEPLHLFNLLRKSWYIGLFHLPLLASTYWKLSSKSLWQKVLKQLEQKDNLPVSDCIKTDGQFGIALYRANFIPAFLNPRPRYAQCPVQAVVLKQDAFVNPEYIEIMRGWVKDFSRVNVDANHWAILSRPQEIAGYIRQFALQHNSTK